MQKGRFLAFQEEASEVKLCMWGDKWPVIIALIFRMFIYRTQCKDGQK